MEGVVSRLGQHQQNDEVHFIDPLDEKYIEEVVELKPTIVVVDSEQCKGDKLCILCDLLSAFSDITILRLKAQEKDVQVITSSSFVVENVQGLIDLLGER